MDRIRTLEAEIDELRKKINLREMEIYEQKLALPTDKPEKVDQRYMDVDATFDATSKVPGWAIERYSRQLLVPGIGVDGQEKLMKSKVLIVGAGGLGCPAGAYLAGAGIGEIGVVDYDLVEISNIHRQILHTHQDIHQKKVDSLAESLRRLNPYIKVETYNVQLDSTNALDIISKYHVVLDCTDNVPSRYLINDACVLAKVPLISASALKMEGQLTIYGYRMETADETISNPCYRCMFPTPPSPDNVGSCATSGIVGPVTGTMGSLQALEAIKMMSGQDVKNLLVGRMLIFDGADCTFKNVKLRNKNPNCASCSDNPTIKKLIDYESFCKSMTKSDNPNLCILKPNKRVTVNHLWDKINAGERLLLVDVRSKPEYDMCHLHGAVNFPMDNFRRSQPLQDLNEKLRSYRYCYVICRRGNDSQIAANKISLCIDGDECHVKDVIGGLNEWSKLIDPSFPSY